MTAREIAEKHCLPPGIVGMPHEWIVAMVAEGIREGMLRAAEMVKTYDDEVSTEGLSDLVKAIRAAAEKVTP